MKTEADNDADDGLDLDADLKAAYSEHSKALKSEPEAAAAAPEPVAKEPAAAAAPAATEAPRKENGQFAKKSAPKTWRKEVAPKFEALDPDVQDEIERREQDMEKGFKEVGNAMQSHKAWDEVIGPYKATMQSLGLPAPKMVQSLLNLDHTMRYGTPEQKAAMYQQFVGTYGLNPEQLPRSQQQAPLDPRVQALMQETQQLKAMLSTRQQQETMQMHQMANATIDKFKQGAEDYEAVREDMARAIQSGWAVGTTDAEMLQDAYDKVTWGRADLRAKRLAGQQAQQTQESARLAEKAKASAVVNVPVKGKVAASAPALSWEEDLTTEVRKSGLFSH